jgi:hypothetical protein
MAVNLRPGCFEGPFNIEVKTSDEAIAAYNALRPQILAREVMKGKFNPQHFDLIKDLQIHSATWCATYTNPTTHAREVVDLWAIEESTDEQEAELKSALIQLRNNWPACANQDHKAYVAHSQRSESGLRPLVKNSKDAPLKNLSHDVKHAIENLLPDALARINTNDPKRTALIRDVFTRRLLFVEQFCTKWTQKYEAAIQEKTQELNTPNLDPQVARKLQGELGELKRLQEELKNLDIYAVCKVLLAYPAGGNPPYSEIVRVVEGLQEKVSKELLEHVEADWKQKASRLEKLKDHSPFAAKRTLSAGQAAYAREVALGAILNREDYHQYCTDKKIPMRKEGLTDLFIREAIKFAETLPNDQGKYEPETEYMAEGIQKSVFLRDVSEGLKAKLQSDLKDLGIITTHAIGTRKEADNEYETQALEQYPANADAKKKKEIDESNANKARANLEALKTHVQAHRDRVNQNSNLTLEDAKADWPKPPPPPPPPPENPDILESPVPVPGPLQRLAHGGIELLRPFVPEEYAPKFNQFAQNFGTSVSLMTAATAGYYFLTSATPAAIIEALGNNAPAFLVQGVQLAQENPQTFMAVATMLGMMITWAYPNKATDGTIARKLDLKRTAAALTTVAAGAAVTLRSPEAVAQFFTASVEYLSTPRNLLDLFGYTAAANQGFTALRERRIAPAVRGAALGAAVYFGGNTIAAAGQTVADTAHSLVNSNIVTTAAGAVASAVDFVAFPLLGALAVHKLVPVQSSRLRKVLAVATGAAIGGALYYAGATPSITSGALSLVKSAAGAVAAPLAIGVGTRVYSRLLPAPVGEVVDKGVARYTSNRIQTVSGTQLGGLAAGAANVSMAAIRWIFSLFILAQYFLKLSK